MRLFFNGVMMLALIVWGLGCDSPPANSNDSPDDAPGANTPANPPGAPGEMQPGETQPGEQQPQGNGLNSSPENQLTPGNLESDPAPSLPGSDPQGGNP